MLTDVSSWRPSVERVIVPGTQVPVVLNPGSRRGATAWPEVRRLLTEAGCEVVDPEVGEFCTSFDMAGASLTLLWLDDTPGELEQLWSAPCDTCLLYTSPNPRDS